MPAGGSYGNKALAGETATTLKRSPATRVSYINTKRQVRTKEASQHFGHVKPLPKP